MCVTVIFSGLSIHNMAKITEMLEPMHGLRGVF